MGNQSSALTSALSTAEVSHIFQAAGTKRALHDGNVLISQGDPSEMMYFVEAGEAVITKRDGTGKEKTLTCRGPGEVLGELSFLLRKPPAVGVKAKGFLEVIELQQTRVFEILQDQPALAAQVFRFLACTVAARIAESSKLIRSTVNQLQPSNAAAELAATKLQLSPPEIAAAFDIDAKQHLILHCRCSMTIEQNSVRGQESAGIIYLFESYVCVESTAFGMTRRYAVHLQDVLGLLRPDGTTSLHTVEIQCRSLSVLLNLPGNYFDSVVQGVEAARLGHSHSVPTAERLPDLNDVGAPRSGMPDAPGRKQSTMPHRKQSITLDEQVTQMMKQTNMATPASDSQVVAALTPDNWSLLLSGSERRKYKRGDLVLREGERTRALFQLARGVLRVEVKIKNRPQAVVLRRAVAGEMFGERTLLLGGNASASLVVDSDEAVVLKLPSSFLETLFASHPELQGKFFCYLATMQAERLHAVNQQEAAPEIVLPAGTVTPTDMAGISDNLAFLTIFYKYVKSLKDEQLCAQLEFYIEARAARLEGDAQMLPFMANRIFQKFVSARAERPINCISNKKRLQIEQDVKSASKMSVAQQRQLFNVVSAVCLKALEDKCMQGFLVSPHYQYVLALKAKECQIPAMEHFKALRVLGQGGFGQVLEVVKRDCGKHYAMKVMRKKDLQEVYGAGWQEIVQLERTLHACTHHPLIVNLAYAFQNAKFLVLIMDACPGGDLSDFALTSERLTPTQVHFVGLEVVAMITHLHKCHILYRDLKPENLLLDDAGHVRLIDFGLALYDKKGLPQSCEVCGTPCYMAPEVKFAKKLKKNYSGAADWYTLGVLMYELSEQALPFDDDPQFDAKTVYRRPQLLNEKGEPDRALHDLVHRLLEPGAQKRLGSGGSQQVMDHEYWKQPEWDLVAARRLTSPLRALVARRMQAPREEKLRKQQKAALQTATAMAEADALSTSKVAASNKSGNRQGGVSASGNLPDWGFTAMQAISQEYLDSASSCVSLV